MQIVFERISLYLSVFYFLLNRRMDIVFKPIISTLILFIYAISTLVFVPLYIVVHILTVS